METGAERLGAANDCPPAGPLGREGRDCRLRRGKSAWFEGEKTGRTI